jgi:hypothetical protein
MPLKRDSGPKAKTPLQLAADRELDDVLEMLDPVAGPRARMLELIELDRDLEPSEQAEFDRFVARRDKHRRQSRELDEAIERRQRKHPDENRGDAALAVMLKQSDKRQRRRQRRHERETAAELTRARERAEAVAQVAAEPASAVAAPYAEPAEVALADELGVATRRPRQRVGIVFQTDLHGNRID